jgi:hypothetical protein
LVLNTLCAQETLTGCAAAAGAGGRYLCARWCLHGTRPQITKTTTSTVDGCEPPAAHTALPAWPGQLDATASEMLCSKSALVASMRASVTQCTLLCGSTGCRQTAHASCVSWWVLQPNLELLMQDGHPFPNMLIARGWSPTTQVFSAGQVAHLGAKAWWQQLWQRGTSSSNCPAGCLSRVRNMCMSGWVSGIVATSVRLSVGACACVLHRFCSRQLFWGRGDGWDGLACYCQRGFSLSLDRFCAARHCGGVNMV